MADTTGSSSSSSTNRNNRSSSSSLSLTPFAPLFYILNIVAFLGWSFVLYKLLLHEFTTETTTTQELLEEVRNIIIGLEIICSIEVLRIFVGDLPGSLTLGVILHVIRFTAILEVLPRGAKQEDTTTTTVNDGGGGGSSISISVVKAVLFSWAVTEVTRYPMYLFPRNELCRSIRLVVPLFTFPVGAWAEGYGAYNVLFRGQESISIVLQILLLGIIIVNGMLGPALAYPHIFWKAAPILGLIQHKKKEKGNKKDDKKNK